MWHVPQEANAWAVRLSVRAQLCSRGTWASPARRAPIWLLTRYTRHVGDRYLHIVSAILIAVLGGVPAVGAVCGWACAVQPACTDAAPTPVEASSHHHGESNGESPTVDHGEHHRHQTGVTEAAEQAGAPGARMTADCCRFSAEVPLASVLPKRSDDVRVPPPSTADLWVTSGIHDDSSDAPRIGDAFRPLPSRTSRFSAVLRI